MQHHIFPLNYKGFVPIYSPTNCLTDRNLGAILSADSEDDMKGDIHDPGGTWWKIGLAALGGLLAAAIPGSLLVWLALENQDTLRGWADYVAAFFS